MLNGIGWNQQIREEKYNDENWTKLGFNDTEWSNSLAPFGDSSIDGINHKPLGW